MTEKPSAADWLSLNRARWDERVPIHADTDFYDLRGFVGGRDALRGVELAEVGDVRGKQLLHLQCHIGTDTLSWARHGAAVTGVDFSVPAIRMATELADRIGVRNARFLVSDVYDAPTVLGRQTYDIVYTGGGALNWLPDIQRWAQIAALMVAPGGFLYLFEFHPFSLSLSETDGRTVAYDYFRTDPQVWDDAVGSYADPDAPTTANAAVEWHHQLGDIVSALIAAGLRLELLHEHDFTLFQQYPMLRRAEGGYRMPPGRPRVPLMFSLRASKPERR